VLRALLPYLQDGSQPISVIVGSSIGAINGLIAGACLKHGLSHAVEQLHEIWIERTYRNTFANSPSKAFLRAIKVAATQYLAPGPHANAESIFDPTPLVNRVDQVLKDNGGLKADNRHKDLTAVGVMTTLEGEKRKPLLFLSARDQISTETMSGATFQVRYHDDLHAKHGFASAALPSVLPPVELDDAGNKLRLVDGGISQNVPVDPAVRLGAHRVIVLDISGRSWWLDRYGEAHDTRPKWEVPAELETFCMRPPETLVIKNQEPFGPLLKAAVGSSSSKFISAVGPVWPLFTLLRKKLGEDIAYETMSYVALDRDYIQGLLERGFNETNKLLRHKVQLEFTQSSNYKQWASGL
jgi:predicted acylesterase/phospholipase RssA